MRMLPSRSTWSNSGDTCAAAAGAELELQPLEAAPHLLRAACHIVRFAEPDRPARRRPEARQTQQAVHRLADELALQVVQRRVERRARGELALRQPRHDLLEREGV